MMCSRSLYSAAMCMHTWTHRPSKWTGVNMPRHKAIHAPQRCAANILCTRCLLCVCPQVTAHVSDAVSKGAKVLAGGKVPELPEPLSNGHFYTPTVLADATIDM